MPRRPGLRVVRRKGYQSLYLRGTVYGIRVYESLGTDDAKLAEEARAIREAEIYRSAVLGARPKVTFAAAVLSYLESDRRSKATEILIGRLVRHFGPNLLCDQVDQSRIDKACSSLLRHGAAPATKMRNIITPTKAVLMHAARRKWCDLPVFESPKGTGKRTDWLTPSEVEAQIAAAADHLQPLLVFLYCTGARLGEALRLEWNDVDLQHARVVLRDTKNGDDRLVDLPVRAVASLANISNRKDRVFLDHRGRPYRETETKKHGAIGGQIRTAWATSLKGAGIKKPVTPHHARHTWATWHYCVHRDPLRLKNDGAWKSLSQVERYAKLVPETMREDVLKFLSHLEPAVVAAA